MFKLISKISKWILMLIGMAVILGLFALSIVTQIHQTEVLQIFNWLLTIPEANENWNFIINQLINFFTNHSETFLISMSIIVGIIFIIAPIAYRINYKRDMRKIHALIGKSNTAVSKVVRSSRI